MKLLSRVCQVTVVSSLALVSTIRLSGAFDNNAHLTLSQRARGISTVDNFLKANLTFELRNGINQIVEANKTGTALIREGVLLEDSNGGVFQISA